MNYSERALGVGAGIHQIRVNHTLFKEALTGIGRTIQIGNHLREPTGMSVIAPAGAGKSLLIECVKKNVCNWKFLDPSGMLVVSLKEMPTVAQIQEDLLTNFNYVIPPKVNLRTNATFFNLLVAAIAQHCIWLIALDEFQHVFLAKKNGVHAAVIDWLKRLMTQTRVPILLCGTEALRKIESADPQLSTRIPAVFNLTAFSDDAEWKGLLNAFAKASKEIDLCPLADKYSTPLFDATEGIFRTLKNLIVEAAMIAIDEGHSAVDKQHLHDAFQRVVGPGSTKANPFS
jgi:hypothetical protein